MPAKCSIRSALYAAIITLVAVGLVAKAQADAQEAADPRSEALKKAAKAGAVSMLGFFELGIARQGPPVPKSGPIPGLDDPNAVPFLIDILENGPSWENKRLLGWRGGVCPHIARCKVALSLGLIGDKRAYDPLIRMLQHGNFLEEKFKYNNDVVYEHPICNYAALALGYLGDQRAVEPLISALQNSECPWAVYGLTKLDAVEAIEPIIQYGAKKGWIDSRMHGCLLYLSRTHFVNTIFMGRFRFREFPELGDLEGRSAYLALWQHWLKAGDAYAKKSFEENYAKWLRMRKDRPDSMSERYLYDKMVSGGIATLPYIMAELDKGEDDALVLAAEHLKAGGYREAILRRQATARREKAETLQWWAENKERWTLFQSPETKAD